MAFSHKVVGKILGDRRSKNSHKERGVTIYDAGDVCPRCKKGFLVDKSELGSTIPECNACGDYQVR